MTLIERIKMIERIHGLIRRKATGRPKELACRLGISERQTFRLIGELKDMGFPIEYSKYYRSYYYDESVRVSFEIVVGDDKILGGNGFIIYTVNFCQQSSLNLISNG